MNGFSRRAALARMASEPFDLLVVGGGITGCGVAREAALRGLKVALVEARDFASGTSSRSTRLIHGGLRYLRQGELRLVRESVRERQVLLSMAPHLVRPLPFLFPVYAGDPDPLPAVRLGIAVYNRLGGLPIQSRELLLPPDAVLEAMPLLRRQGLRGGARYEDALTDDARLTLAVAQSAAAEGAAVANYCRALRYTAGGSGGMRVAQVRDEESGDVFDIAAAHILIAAGPWTDAARLGRSPLLRLTKGVHLAVRREDLPLATACVLRGADRRLMFAVPDGPVSYIGTTDTDVDAPDDDAINSDDARYVLAAAQRAFPGANLEPDAVIGAWAGVRPLVRAGSAALPSRVSRDYKLHFAQDGLVYVAGGKLTAFRAMAEHIVDRLFPATRGAQARARSIRPLPGGEGALPGPEDWRRLGRVVSIPSPVLSWELTAYGSAAANVLAELPAERKDSPPLYRVARMRLRYAVLEEMALHLTDVLLRRTSLLRFGGPGVRGRIAPLGAEMAELQGWSETRREAEVAAAERAFNSMFAWRQRLPQP